MPGRIRQADWSATPLGRMETWPAHLQSSLSLCLDARYPIAIYWGPELAVLYNDAWSPILGNKHPWALGRPGREVWSEIWDIIGPMFEQVFATGEGTRSNDQLLPMLRHGYTEECYFDYTFSPIRGPGGTVDGIFNAVTETTYRVLSERRTRALRDLAERTSTARTAEEACHLAAEALRDASADVPFALLYLLDADGANAHLIASTGIEAGSPAASERVGLQTGSPSAWPLREASERAAPIVVEGLAGRFGQLPGGPWPEPATRAMVLPVAATGKGGTAGFLIAGVSPRRAIDEAYRAFFELAAGHIATAIANARAYEEEKRRAEALAALDAAKTAFFSNVSHEFRTPLALMLGPVEELLSRSHTDLSPAAREQLDIVNRNGMRLLRLVNNLLDFSRLEAGRMRAAYEPTDLAAFTAELASVFRAAIERAGLQLVVDCPPLPEPAYVDREMWERVVLNLVSNAFKFTLEGQIGVSVKARDGMVELRVRDTGSGIPVWEMPRLFERFHRIQNAHGRTHEGSGIGLALVHELVKLHGGSVAAESELGRGSTFIVTIPLGSAHLPADQVGTGGATLPAGAAASPFIEEALRWLPDSGPDPDPAEVLPAWDTVALPYAPGPKADDRPRVLIADDNADMRSYLARILAERHRVETAPDGQAALEMARQRPPDLVLTDVMMPRLDGFGLIRELRHDGRTAHLPVIMLSARAGEESRVEGIEAGADDYLVKPFSARELLARVGGHLQMARVRREANQALQSSEQRLRMALEASRMFAWAWDLETSTVTNSHGAQDVLGFLDQHPPVTGWELVHPEDHAALQRAARAALASGGEFAVDVRIIRPDDGRVLWLHIRGRPENDDAGIPVRLVGTSMDITERKLSEALLAEQKRLLELIVAGASQQECLEALTDSVSRLHPSARACVVLANRERSAIGAVYATDFPEAFGESVIGVAIEEDPAGSCALAMHEGRAVTCSDLAASTHWAPEWRALCLANGVRACSSTPVFSADGLAVASFFLCLSDAREPNDWELRIAEFGVHIASIVIERERTTSELRERTEQLEAHAQELSRFNRVAVGRELRLIELKKEVNELCRILGMEERYELAFERDSGPAPWNGRADLVPSPAPGGGSQ